MHRRLALTIGLLTIAAATASAEETLLKTPRIFDVATLTAPGMQARGVRLSWPERSRRQPDLVAPLAPAQTPAPAITTSTNVVEHQFGAGARLGGYSFGFGGNVRYFFYGGPLGIQGDLAYYSYSLETVAGVTLAETIDWSALQFSPSAIYRFPERRFQGPVRLMPYAAVGMSFIHTFLDDEDDAFSGLFPDDTSVGVLIAGGVEIFFDKIPRFSAGGELVYVSNSEDLNISANSLSSLPWPAFVATAHWYFK